MEETAHQRHATQSRATDESSDGARESSAMESAGRAVARLLANPRRTRRD